jgi:hypothetical protein
MSASDDKAQIAWQPLTTRGVAAFAGASLGRLLLVQLIVALLTAGVVVWFLQQCWFPTVGEAILALPPQGEIRNGILIWSGPSRCLLAEGRFLGIAVDPKHTGEVRSTAHMQVEFGRAEFKIRCLLWQGEVAYPHNKPIAFNRAELWPWWGAWRPAILAMAAAAVVAGMMATWAFLATLYCLPAWLIGLFANRECSLGGSWRLAGAALLPGALLMCVALCLYGLGVLDLLRLTLAAAMHMVVGWICLALSPLRLPRATPAGIKSNPFT